MIFFIFFDEYVDNNSYICFRICGATFPQSDIRIKKRKRYAFLVFRNVRSF